MSGAAQIVDGYESSLCIGCRCLVYRAGYRNPAGEFIPTCDWCHSPFPGEKTCGDPSPDPAELGFESNEGEEAPWDKVKP